MIEKYTYVYIYRYVGMRGGFIYGYVGMQYIRVIFGYRAQNLNNGESD